MQEIIGARLQGFGAPGAMGVVTNTRYIRCYWPAVDAPVALFANGSSGIEVMGPPTPRNIVFPADTVHLEFYPDALYPAELAVFAAQAAAGKKPAFVNLTDAEAAIWRQAYDAAVASFPDTHAVHETRPDCHFLVQNVVGSNPKKPDRYVAELTAKEASDVATGKVQPDILAAQKTFVLATDGITVKPANAVLADPAVKP